MAQAFHGGRLCEAAKEFGLSPGAFVDFSANTNVHAPTVSAAHWEEWRTGIARYPEADAHSIRRQLAEIYHVPAEQLLPAAGAIEALYLAARLFPTSKVAIVEPAFSDYQRAFVAAGCDAVRVTLPYEMWHQPISHWHHLLAPFDVIVLGNPNNPTGSLQRRAELLRVLEGDDAGSKTWIIDEAFIEFVADQESETLMPFLNEHPTLIVLRSLTKTWRIPGLRLGFLATANASWMASLSRMQPPWTVNAVAEAWARSSLSPDHHARLLSDIARLHELKERLATRLAQISGLRVHPAAANFLLVELTDPSLDATDLYQALGRRGLLVRVCDSFHGIPKGRFIRVAVRTEAENSRLAQELAAICEHSIRKTA